MCFHVTFVGLTVLGKRVEWAAQTRDEQPVTFRQAVRVHRLHTLADILGAGLLYLINPGLFCWTLPVSVGLALSIPLSIVLSNPALGRLLRRAGLLLITSETQPDPVVTRYNELLEDEAAWHPSLEPPDAFLKLLTDPVLHSLHLQLLEVCHVPSQRRSPLSDRIRNLLLRAPRGLSSHDKRAILANPSVFREVHLLIWSHWPVQQLRAFTESRAPAAGWR